MATPRLDSDERRKAIVTAAVPLFARKGFAGTTTRELAEAAHISEALLFKHFPSKKNLYGEILQLGCEGDPALEKLAALEPSTLTLVRMTHYMVRYFLEATGAEPAERDSRLRLVLHSFLEDGEYARELFETIFGHVHPLFAASVEAAAAAGDLVKGTLAAANSFWFGHHVAAMMAFVFLPARACLSYHGTLSSLVDETSRFVLRGFGMTDTAIARSLAIARESPLEFSASGEGGGDGR
jgi:TetR/AcrR family transcriptional regulator, transcriptional repressor of aconitase